MKSHGILSRYMRPGFEEGGDTWWDKTKKVVSDVANMKLEDTYDAKKRKEIDKKWATRKSEIDDVAEYDTETYRLLNDALKDTLYQSTTNPGGGYLENLQQWHELANTGRLEGAEGIFFGPGDSKLIKEDVESMMALPIGTREVRPGDYDERVLSWDEVESARKNKDFRDYKTRDDHFFNPSNYMKYLDQSAPGYKAEEGESWADPSWSERENRYLNANTPAEYKKLLNRRSYDTPRELAEIADTLSSFYGLDNNLYKDDTTVWDKTKEKSKRAVNTALGGGKLGLEHLLGFAARSVPVSPVDVYNMGLKEAWSGEDRNKAWGWGDQWNYAEEIPWSEYGYLAGFSDLLGGREGAGKNPYFGYEGGFQANEDLYNEEAFKTHPMLKNLIVEEMIEKETKENDARIQKAIDSGLSEQEAYDMYPNNKVNRWYETVEKGKYPTDIDYSKYNRLNIRQNLPSHILGGIGALLGGGKVAAAAKILKAAKAGAPVAVLSGLIEKASGVKGLVVAGGAGVAESISDKNKKEKEDLGPDFFDPSVY